MKLKPGKLEETTWEQVKEQVKKTAPDIYEGIENISPAVDDSFKLYIAEYPYGAMIVDENGEFNIPCGDDIVSIKSAVVPEEIKEQFGYNYPNIGLGLILNGSLELSRWVSSTVTDQAERFNPFEVFDSGNIIALNAVLDLPHHFQLSSFWRIYSGCHTAYMLASIGNAKKFEKIREHFEIITPLPSKQNQHWKLFRDIANSQKFQTHWCSRVLFFGNKWIQGNSNNLLPFRACLLERMRKNTVHLRNKAYPLKIWQDFIPYIKQRNKKADNFILNHVRYLLDAAFGSELSFKIAEPNSDRGPFYEIAQAFEQIYDLNSMPLILHANSYSSSVEPFAYITTQLNPLKIQRKNKSHSYYLQSDFKEMKEVLNYFKDFSERYFSSILKSQIEIYNANDYQFDFYSAHPDEKYGVKNVSDIFQDDRAFEFWSNMRYNNVYGRNTFARVMVRISRSK